MMGHAFRTGHIQENHGTDIAPLLWYLVALTLLGTTTGLGILLGAGKWLVREDPLEQAAAIAVLSGNIPTRALEAARLYHDHDGYAKEISLTHTRTHAGGLKVLWIYYPRESDFNVWVLWEQGVPAKGDPRSVPRSSTQPKELDVISAAPRAAGDRGSSWSRIRRTRGAFISCRRCFYGT
jgi:hypothetical protein